MNVVVQTGLQWMQLKEQIKNTMLFFAVDPSPSAKLGAITGTCASGTNAFPCGAIRDWVINLTVVLADVRKIKFRRRRARTTTAGYDLPVLLAGAEGPLGIVAGMCLQADGHSIPPETKRGSGSLNFPTIRAAAPAAKYASPKVIPPGVPVAHGRGWSPRS